MSKYDNRYGTGMDKLRASIAALEAALSDLNALTYGWEDEGLTVDELINTIRERIARAVLEDK